MAVQAPFKPEEVKKAAELPPSPEPRPEPLPGSLMDRVKTHMDDTAGWITDLQVPLGQKVEDMLSDPLGLFTVDTRSPGEFARRVGPRFMILGDLYGKILGEEVVIKQELKDLQDILQDTEAMVLIEQKDGKKGESTPAKPDTVAVMEARVRMDPRVVAAREAVSLYTKGRWAQLVETKARIHQVLSSLREMCEVIPGFQGQARDLMRESL